LGSESLVMGSPFAANAAEQEIIRCFPIYGKKLFSIPDVNS
jgi:hypothetical protein